MLPVGASPGLDQYALKTTALNAQMHLKSAVCIKWGQRPTADSLGEGKVCCCYTAVILQCVFQVPTAYLADLNFPKLSTFIILP